MTRQRLATIDLPRTCQRLLARLALLWLVASLVCGSPGVVAILVASSYAVPTEEELPERHGSEVEVRHAAARAFRPHSLLARHRHSRQADSAMCLPVSSLRRGSGGSAGFLAAAERGAGIYIRC